jgi:hypothetical protein
MYLIFLQTGFCTTYSKLKFSSIYMWHMQFWDPSSMQKHLMLLVLKPIHMNDLNPNEKHPSASMPRQKHYFYIVSDQPH